MKKKGKVTSMLAINRLADRCHIIKKKKKKNGKKIPLPRFITGYFMLTYNNVYTLFPSYPRVFLLFWGNNSCKKLRKKRGGEGKRNKKDWSSLSIRGACHPNIRPYTV